MRPTRKLKFGVFLGVMLMALPAVAQPRHVRVVWTDTPSERATVLWTSPSPKPGEVVVEGTSVASHPVPVRPAADREEWIHRADLDGLSPGAVVPLRVVANGEESPPLWFRTAPADERPFTLLAGGDSRSDPRTRRAMNDRLREMVAEDETIVALNHGGDYVADGSSWVQWRRWLDDWERTTGDDGRLLPIIPTRGNHERDGELFNAVFGGPGQPDADGDWYVTRLGRDFALVTLDSNASQAGEQRAWLDAILRGLQNTRWIAASYHRPAYPAVKSPGGALYHWVPLFEQYNVDFVLESDGHVLKRTVPIRAGQEDPTGVVYLGEGGLGVPQRSPDTSRWYLQKPGMAMSAHHMQRLRVTAERVSYEAHDLEGEILDRYEFLPRRLGQTPTVAPTIRPLPVGEPPPPPSPPLTYCRHAAGRAPGAAWLLLGIALVGWRRRRSPQQA